MYLPFFDIYFLLFLLGVLIFVENFIKKRRKPERGRREIIWFSRTGEAKYFQKEIRECWYVSVYKCTYSGTTTTICENRVEEKSELFCNTFSKIQPAMFRLIVTDTP